MLTKSSIQIRILLVLAIILVLNFLASQVLLRFDFTGDKRYTLSKATKDILKNLEEPVTVTAFFSDNLPPHIQKTRTDFQEMLIEYANRSGGNLAYEFVNPNESTETEREAQQNGIRPVSINVRERDKIEQQRAYLGAKLQYAEETEVIPFVQPGAAMEYALSSSIKKISVADKPKIGLVGGHGEAAAGAMQQIKQSLDILYNLETVNLSDSALVDAYKTLMIVAPKDTFIQADLDALDRFLAAGKGILIAMNRVDADLQTASGSVINTGLETWLASKGITVGAEFVIDANCGAVTVQDQQNTFFGIPMQRRVSFPFLPIMQNFADHPITQGLEQVIFPFASPVNYNATDSASGGTFVPLVFSSKKSGLEAPPLTFDVQKEWTDQDFPTSKVAIAGALDGANRMVVFGDGDFAVNGEGQQAQRMEEDNINLLVNAVDWLSDDTGLNELRTKAVTSRPIEKELDDTQKQLVKFGNFLFPIFLIIFYGFIRAQRRKSQRARWATENYG